MNCSHRIRWAPLVVAWFALLGGCGTAGDTSTGSPAASLGDPAGAESPVDADEGTPTDAADASPREPSVEATGGEGESDGAKTLQDYLGSFDGGVLGGAATGGGFDNERFAEQRRLVEQEIQRCMKAQGFEYVPRSDTGVVVVFGGPQSQGTSAEEYAKERGFGISTGFDEMPEPASVPEAAEDPNAAYLDALSDGEADAWVEALYGSAPERDADGELIKPESGFVIRVGPGIEGGPSGCAGEAETKVRGDFTAFASIADDLAALDARIQVDPRIVQLGREWSECMSDVGFFYSSEREAIDDIQRRFEPIMMSFFGDGPVELEVEDNGTGGGVIALSGGDFELTPEQEADLAALQTHEIAVASASVACKAGTADEIADIVARYEAEFVAANQAVLESISSGSGN